MIPEMSLIVPLVRVIETETDNAEYNSILVYYISAGQNSLLQVKLDKVRL